MINLIQSLALFLLLMGCSLDESLSEGGSTEVGNPELAEEYIQGTIVTDSGVPVVSKVSIVSEGYSLLDTQQVPYYTTTSSTGAFSIPKSVGLNQGRYTLQAVDTISGKQFITQGLVISDTAVVTINGKLMSPGFIILNGEQFRRGALYIPGTTYGVTTDSSTPKGVSLAVAAGEYAGIRWYDEDLDRDTLVLHSLLIEEGNDYSVDLPKYGTSSDTLETADPDSLEALDPDTINDIPPVEDTTTHVLVIIEEAERDAQLDQPFLDILDSLSIQVTIIGSDAVPLDSLLADIDAIIALPTALSTVLGTRYTAIEKPILVMEPWLQPLMGMTGDRLDIDYSVGLPMSEEKGVRVKEPIQTNLLSDLVSEVTLFTENQTMSFGMPSASATVVLIHGGSAPKVLYYYYSKGDAMQGSDAPELRMALLLNETKVPFLTSEGYTLFKNAVSFLVTHNSEAQ
ncbi:MAG: carboxypeptidase-like regulatory domain-containing protein [Fibrobacterales bacterium]